MEQELFESKFNEIKSRLKQHFGKLTDDEISQIRGKKDLLINKLQAKYGYSREKAQEELSKFLKQHGMSEQPSHSHSHAEARSGSESRRSNQPSSSNPREERKDIGNQGKNKKNHPENR